VITRRSSVTLLSSDGQVFATYGDFHGGTVDAQELPPYVIQAVVATEDHRFFDHWGMDIKGTLRALLANIRAGHVVQGGSTITQQLAKNFLQASGTYSYDDRSIRRKIQELILTVWLEHEFTKNQILTMYLNRVYFGAHTYGINAAAHRYFGKPAQTLTLLEAAIIAGLPQAPSRYAPTRQNGLAFMRAKTVLKNMVKHGFITEAVAQEAENSGLTTQNTHTQLNSANYFADWVVETIPNYVNTHEDIVVVTTLNLQHQKVAEELIRSTIDKNREQARVTQGALVSMQLDGAVTALIGGISYNHSPFNRATQALRQPGSAFKIPLFLAALEAGVMPNDLIEDTPIQLGTWSPRNYKWQSRGIITIEQAFAYSINTCAVRLAQKVGVAKVIEVARRLGITSPQPDNLTIALGTGEVTLLEMTGAFTTLANGGTVVWPHGILEIYNHRGELLYKREKSTEIRVVAPIEASLMNQLLRSVMDYGNGKRARLDEFDCIGKTGTTQDHRDAWLVASAHPKDGSTTPTPLAVGVWVGNDNYAPTHNITGGRIPGAIWKSYMKQVMPTATPASQTSSRP
jgi:penicillin-binding protein 1A